MSLFPRILALASLLAFLPAPALAIETAFEEDRSLPVVNLNVALKAGTVTDPEGQAGLTNFMGEMLIRGTRSRDKEQLDLALDQMGAELEVETRAESMIFRGSVLASQLEPFLKLLTEILTQPSLPERELRKLKSEIIAGIQEELGNDTELADRTLPEFLFRGHPYGKPILGKRKDIAGLTREQVAAHYERLVQDRYLLVVGTGDAPADRIEAWARELGKARPGTSGQDRFLVDPPKDAPSRRLLIVDKPDRTQTQIRAGQIGLKMTDRSYFPIYLANHAFGGGSFSARLMVEIRVKRGWSYGAGSTFRHGLRPRSWTVGLFPAAKDTPAALEHTLRMVEELRDKGITADEFAFTQQSLVNRAGFMYNTPKKRVENKLLERTLDLPDGFMKSFGPELSKVKLEDVNAELKRFVKPDTLSIVVVGTAKELRGPLAKAAGLDPKAVEVRPYTAE